MAFTAVSEDILIQPGVGSYNMIASGNIYKGQAVTLCADSTVKAPSDNNQRLFGVADAAVTDGQMVCIYGPKNIVYCKLSGAQTVGTKVGVISEGYMSNLAAYAASEQAIVIKGTTGTGDGKVLILG